jgi:hypothetical protein
VRWRATRFPRSSNGGMFVHSSSAHLCADLWLPRTMNNQSSGRIRVHVAALPTERELGATGAPSGVIAMDSVPLLIVSRDQLRAHALDHRHCSLLSLVNGHTTVEALTDMSGIDSGEIFVLIVDLVNRGILRLREDSSSWPSASDEG